MRAAPRCGLMTARPYPLHFSTESTCMLDLSSYPRGLPQLIPSALPVSVSHFYLIATVPLCFSHPPPDYSYPPRYHPYPPLHYSYPALLILSSVLLKPSSVPSTPSFVLLKPSSVPSTRSSVPSIPSSVLLYLLCTIHTLRA
eukprot:1212537-Rhodomonas_salina.2